MIFLKLIFLGGVSGNQLSDTELKRLGVNIYIFNIKNIFENYFIKNFFYAKIYKKGNYFLKYVILINKISVHCRV